jgi:hypothetical protein
MQISTEGSGLNPEAKNNVATKYIEKENYIIASKRW